jgi:hypothetical protein
MSLFVASAQDSLAEPAQPQMPLFQWTWTNTDFSAKAMFPHPSFHSLLGILKC